MARTSKSTALNEARRRAREAQATANHERLRHDQQVEDTTTAYYLANVACETLETQLHAARAERDTHIHALLDLDESPTRIAVLTGRTATEIRHLKRTVPTSPSDPSAG